MTSSAIVHAPIPFENTYTALPETCFSRQRPSLVAKPEMVRINHELAQELRIDADWLNSAEAVQVFSGNEVAAGSDPIAQAYAGHQFGHFVHQLGDGRAILLGEVINLHGQRRDIVLKGSGRTAFSRGGDGKCALGPAIREYLVSEAMHALGVPTTRALAVVTTGDIVRRDEPLAGAVFTRIAASHLRVGTFAYFAAREDHDSLRSLLQYAVSRHGGTDAFGLLRQTIQRQASLIAHWMSLGFIHGVMNTDNCSISGETIDYGPCAFMDTFHPSCVFSAIDRTGRYAWARQPEMGQWNMARLAESLMPLLEEEKENAHAEAEAAVSKFGGLFQQYFTERLAAKLGILNDASAPSFITESLRLMAQHHCDFSQFFLYLTDLADHGDPASWLKLFHDPASANEWLAKWRALQPQSAAMRKANPVLIPRNHQVERAIQDGYRGNFSTFHCLADAWRNPWTPAAEYLDLCAPPKPEEVVRQTFCGT